MIDLVAAIMILLNILQCNEGEKPVRMAAGLTIYDIRVELLDAGQRVMLVEEN